MSKIRLEEEDGKLMYEVRDLLDTQFFRVIIEGNVDIVDERDDDIAEEDLGGEVIIRSSE